ncbi:hypothetical protein OPT61_g1616 [Boeremia exigua]|uniref:Uncharacterized protein n=1 Tax=Boeremia exigua TaxID=749465 RepID=A0ACC2IPI6_9PLEO|nr:hypothetical protein OPT61_g1616 [Boeremia exigua]
MTTADLVPIETSGGAQEDSQEPDARPPSVYVSVGASLPGDGVQPFSPTSIQIQRQSKLHTDLNVDNGIKKSVGLIRSISLDTEPSTRPLGHGFDVWPDATGGALWDSHGATTASPSSPLEISEDEGAASDVGDEIRLSSDRLDQNGAVSTTHHLTICVNDNVQDITFHSPTASENSYDERPFTSQFRGSLDVPHSNSQAPSVITDAGDQQELHDRKSQPHTVYEPESSTAFDLLSTLADLDLTPPRHELQERILEAYQRTVRNDLRNDQTFLPKGELVSLITPESVSKEIKKERGDILTPTQIKGFADAVCAETLVQHNGKWKTKSFRKIFALLVISEASSMILHFVDEDVSDLDLPLVPIEAPGIKGFCRKGSMVPLRCFEYRIWSPMKLHNFDDHQWKMLATYFSQGTGGEIMHYKLQEQHILPFVALKDLGEDNSEITGGYGRVFMVGIHKDHHNFPAGIGDLCDRGFAVKQQKHDSDRECFVKEAKILKMFTGERAHRHIVSLLATYEQSGKYHLIFPRGESNLFGFWKNFPFIPTFEHGNILWMAEQCAGIAEGLLRLHRRLTSTAQQNPTHNSLDCIQTEEMSGNDDSITPRVRFDTLVEQSQPQVLQQLQTTEQFAASNHSISKSTHTVPSTDPHHDIPKVFGRHGDVNPGNILWFDSAPGSGDHLRGTLKITDFGQSEVNSKWSKTKTGRVATTRTYRPPECDLPHVTIRQTYDIWGLGCVYLEFVTWMLGGKTLLAKFGKERLSPDYVQNELKADTFFQVVQDPLNYGREPEVKRVVVEFIEKLHEHTNCTEYFHDFLVIIQCDMLVIDSNNLAGLSLIDQFPGAYSSSNFDGLERDFLPERQLSRLITHDTIMDELDKFVGGLGDVRNGVKRRLLERTYDLEARENLATWILSNAHRTFAITVQCSLRPLHLLLTMAIFRDTGFTDEDLPLSDPRVTTPSTRYWKKDIWPPGKLQDFYEKQWRCLVPVFRPGKYHYDLPHNSIVPFTKTDVAPMLGAFSAVHKVKVHPEHQDHRCMQHVAIKEIQVSRANDRIGTDEAWDQEARALENIKDVNHKHIIECIAAIRKGDSRYFMFPWADGGSLRAYWNEKPRQTPNGPAILDALIQLRGLADALVHLHSDTGSKRDSDGANTDYDRQQSGQPELQLLNENDEISRPVVASSRRNIRHGDLKPENILRFEGSRRSLGTLKIADMGLAKQHIVDTQDRTHLTSTRYGTIHYEPPEAVFGNASPRSRLYDIWSMGCITLEFVIWLLYGNDDLNSFYNQVKGDTKQVCQYYEILEAEGEAVVHPVVLQWIKHIQCVDPECSQDSATRDLLSLVRDKLLVVALPPTPLASGESATQHRITAAKFRNALDKIIRKARNPTYLFIGGSRYSARLPYPRSNGSNSLTPDAARDRDGKAAPTKNNLLNIGVLSNHRGRVVKFLDYTLPPLKDWEFNVDNVFAETVLGTIGTQVAMPEPRGRASLCSRCFGLNFWAGGFKMEDTLNSLSKRLTTCDFCRLLFETIESGAFKQLISDTIYIPEFSKYNAELRTPLPIQAGLPLLPNPGSDAFFTIIRLWLENCAGHDSHSECQAPNQVELPSRLIDVGTEAKQSLRLIESGEIEALSDNRYIALSHPWGDIKSYVPFSTLRTSIAQFKKAIPETHLPPTFRDAVTCTRRLGLRYLWIDSLCIIQGTDGDFNEEAKKMEDVFSGAYCVLAASRANSQLDGFLGPRAQRQYATFQLGVEKPFYVCEAIDNFSRDVIDGPLNKRGWVLQERALARRTIYFASRQTYFECGRGVRCETLTSMHNNMADFLGDPHFPNKAMRTPSRALKISYFQGLYKQYSRLDFSHQEDRPFAIAGLEKRLQKAYGTTGGYGIFDDGSKSDGGLFHRSLLWRRGEEQGDPPELVKIVFPQERNIRVPSWSWMAYVGSIDYADPPFQSAEWETKDIIPPWTQRNRSTGAASHDGITSISATVREYEVAEWRPNEVKLVFDQKRTSNSDQERGYCVVVARSNERGSDKQRRYYVLLLVPTQERGRAEQAFRRVGAGFMAGKFISFEQPGVEAIIV